MLTRVFAEWVGFQARGKLAAAWQKKQEEKPERTYRNQEADILESLRQKKGRTNALTNLVTLDKEKQEMLVRDGAVGVAASCGRRQGVSQMVLLHDLFVQFCDWMAMNRHHSSLERPKGRTKASISL